MSPKRVSLLAPKRAVFVAGVFFTAARWLRAGDAGESPYGSGETGDAGAGTDVLKSARVRVTLRLTVSQSVCLGVEPHLGLMTR
jgi:hypothetical protein